MLEYFIGLFEGIGHAGPSVYNIKKLIIRNNNKRIYILFKLFNASDGIFHSLSCFESERLCNYADRKGSLLLGNLGNNRGCTCSCSATHTACDEYHMRALDSSRNRLRRLFGSLFSDLRHSTGAQSLSKLFTYLQQPVGITHLKRLTVCIDTQEFHTGYIFFDHSVYGIITGPADPYDENPCCRFHFIVFNLQHF